MIIVQLKGGLGNQLFQYAAGLSLASYHIAAVKVDISALKKPDEQIGTLRNFELKSLGLAPEIATQQEIDNLINSNPISKVIEKLLPPYKRKIYKEESFSFDPNFYKAGSHLYLKGYRQSERYFKTIKEEVQQQFALKPELTLHLKEKAKELQSDTSVAVHIRRGDYKDKLVADFHGILSEDYYQSAFQYIKARIKNANFYIFTDDVKWVTANMEMPAYTKFVSGTITQNHYEDFYLMSKCRHNIIANSSFSWWAAWLNPNPDKIVIAPKKWFNNPRLDTKDLLPDEWVKI